MHISTAPRPLLGKSGQPETISTLEYAYILAHVTRREHVLIVGRDGKDGRETVEMNRIPGLKEFVAHAVKAVKNGRGAAQILHYEPKAKGREMKAAAWPDFGGIAIRILPLPLDFPLDPEGQRSYDLTRLGDEFNARFVTKH